MTDDWVVGKVRTNSEARLAERCREMGVEPYCPMIKRKRRSPGGTARERFEEPALSGYLPMRAATVEAPETREELYRENGFHDFLRDIDHVIALMKDSDLEPLRAMEKAEPVKFYSDVPRFYLGEIVKVPYNSPHVLKAFWGLKGQIVGVKNGRYCVALEDKVSARMLETWLSPYQLLANG